MSCASRLTSCSMSCASRPTSQAAAPMPARGDRAAAHYSGHLGLLSLGPSPLLLEHVSRCPDIQMPALSLPVHPPSSAYRLLIPWSPAWQCPQASYCMVACLAAPTGSTLPGHLPGTAHGLLNAWSPARQRPQAPQLPVAPLAGPTHQDDPIRMQGFCMQRRSQTELRGLS